MDLKQIIFLLQDTLIGDRTEPEFDLIDVGSRQRADRLQDQGTGFVVADAVTYAEYLKHLRDEGQDCPDIEMFLNRIECFPLYWRSKEWEQLMADVRRIIPEQVVEIEPVPEPEPKPPRKKTTRKRSTKKTSPKE